MLYPKMQYVIGKDASVLQCNRPYDKTVDVKPDLPGNIIVIHGVNDVGTSFGEVETGLCQGLDSRLHGMDQCKNTLFNPGTYRMPVAEDKDRVEPDPDAVYFKRKIDDHTHSPVIPFYWGYRETTKQASSKNGQRIDRYGNRLDKDLSKGGGPFGNATNSLPDMWNDGLFSPKDVGGDPVRPLMSAPGRMYMILAAKRLAALISIIRDYDKDEVVSIVAHSQGCLISLLAQAFLLDEGKRPADTLILTHPPYSLVEDTTMFFGAIEGIGIFGGGNDAAMTGNNYGAINDRQTFDARLRTLAKIVQGVVAKKHPTPALGTLTNQAKYFGMVGTKWTAAADRDNRGKVYLYFCPEDMTVALDNIQGIGWQGVPDHMSGTALSKTKHVVTKNVWGQQVSDIWEREPERRKPLSEIGAGFFQRVFTNKKRLDAAGKSVGPVLVGLPPHDFALRIKGEDDHMHVAGPNRGHRANHDEAAWPPKPASKWDVFSTEAGKRDGLRTITGEALRVPAAADLRGSGQVDPKQFPKTSSQTTLPPKEQGPCEEVDPIDAAIAVTSGAGLNMRRPEIIDDPRPKATRIPNMGAGTLGSGAVMQLEQAMNQGKAPGDQCKIERANYVGDENLNKIQVVRYETPNEARIRWQHEVSPKSFHGAIIGNRENHRNVTAYDVAIGGGTASSDPTFFQYLCAVADWRLKKDELYPRPSILRWSEFIKKYSVYWNVEPASRKAVIEGNASYYSTGVLPACVPSLLAGLPSTVVCETMNGVRTPSPIPAKSAAAPAKKATA